MQNSKPTEQISKVLERIKEGTAHRGVFVYWNEYEALLGLFKNCKNLEEVEEVGAEILKMDLNLGLSYSTFLAYKNGECKEFKTREEAEAFSSLVEEIHREPLIQYAFKDRIRDIIEDIKKAKMAEFEMFEIHRGSEQIESYINQILDYAESDDRRDIVKLIKGIVEEVRNQEQQ